MNRIKVRIQPSRTGTSVSTWTRHTSGKWRPVSVRNVEQQETMPAAIQLVDNHYISEGLPPVPQITASKHELPGSNLA